MLWEEEASAAGLEAQIAGMPRLSLDPRVRSAHALITREIATRILKGTYPVGGVLPNEGQLIVEFGVSRTVLREALKTLAAKGMIHAKTRIGTKVLPESCWNMYDPQVLSWHLDAGTGVDFLARVFEVRQALEPAAAAMAALRRTPANLRRMQLILTAMSCPDHTRESYADWDLHFHQEILSASGNPFMMSFSTVIEASIIRAFSIRAPIDNDELSAKSIMLHRAVLDAIAAGDSAAASKAMSDTIAGGLENVHFELAATPTTVVLPLKIEATTEPG